MNEQDSTHTLVTCIDQYVNRSKPCVFKLLDLWKATMDLILILRSYLISEKTNADIFRSVAISTCLKSEALGDTVSCFALTHLHVVQCRKLEHIFYGNATTLKEVLRNADCYRKVDFHRMANKMDEYAKFLMEEAIAIIDTDITRAYNNEAFLLSNEDGYTILFADYDMKCTRLKSLIEQASHYKATFEEFAAQLF